VKSGVSQQTALLFGEPETETGSAFHAAAVGGCLQRILPERFYDAERADPESVEELKDELFESLPLIAALPSKEGGRTVSFFMLSRYRPNVFKFFYEMISRWLVQGKRLEVQLLFAADFTLPGLGSQPFTVCEMKVAVRGPDEWTEIQGNLPIVEMELRLGLESAYYARRILEVKGLAADEKTAMVQEYLTYISGRLPEAFDQDLFAELQLMLVLCPDAFKESRDSRHLSRLVCSHYLYRRQILKLIENSPGKRHLRLKIFRARIRGEEGARPVLCLLATVNFLQDKEVLEEQHFLKAIQNYIPSARLVKRSFLTNRRIGEPLCTFYLEVEKEGGNPFKSSEIRLLKAGLPSDLKDRIGHLMHPVFMPRNEEEIMRNVLALSSQIKYLRDIPQVLISFDEQSYSHLYFTVIVIRVVVPGSVAIETLFQQKGSFLDYMHDRTKMVGMLKKKYAKEATVFRVKLGSRHFLRQDQSIDLYKARQAVAAELTRIIGEFRDYNGGMISKQHEVLCSLRELLVEETGKVNDLLLENFFYSLTPVIMRTMLDPETLKTLYMMMLEEADKALFGDRPYTLFTKHDEQFAYAMITVKEPAVKEELGRALKTIPRQSASLASSFVRINDTPCLGYIYRYDEELNIELFKETLSYTLEQELGGQ